MTLNHSSLYNINYLFSKTFLLLDEIQESSRTMLNPNTDKNVESSIHIKQISAKWEKESKIPTFKNISLDLKAGDLLAVIGPIGSGKV